MNLDYSFIQERVSDYGKYILDCISATYSNAFTLEQKMLIKWLYQQDRFIVVEKPCKEDIAFFSKQAGITDESKYSIDCVPSAHGGRTKNDGKIHIYPYSKTFQSCHSNEEVMENILENIIVHEIFHYFIRPGFIHISDPVEEEFGHSLTEGLVQLYAETFSERHNLKIPKANYEKEVAMVKHLLEGFSKIYSEQEMHSFIFRANQSQMLEASCYGNEIYSQYKEDSYFRKKIAAFIIESNSALGISKDDPIIKQYIHYYKNMASKEAILHDLMQRIFIAFENNEEAINYFITQLNTIATESSVHLEMSITANPKR